EVIIGEGCALYDWFGGGILESDGPYTTAPGGTGNNYGLELSNACGTASMMIFTVIHDISIQDVHLCGASGLLSLDSLAYNVSPDGTWYFGGEVHSNYYDTNTDTTGHYSYYNALGCLLDSLPIFEWPGVNAGTDTSITVCS